jgi:hypothetical protein
VGASAWDYYVPYQPDLGTALSELRRRVFEAGDYWWAEPNEFKPASEFADRPRTEAQLWADESQQESGTHSILDMTRVLADGEKPEPGTVEPVTEAEALDRVGAARLTRAHVEALQDLIKGRWYGRCAVLHDSDGNPTEIYFWGYSGD